MSQSASDMLGWMARAEDRRLVRLADVRPKYADSLPMGDKLGRKQPHTMGGLTYATYLAQVGIVPRKVPGDFWSLTITDDGYPAAEVACPCGGTPLAEALAPITGCESCERAFFFDGDNVWAFNSPTRAVEPDPED